MYYLQFPTTAFQSIFVLCILFVVFAAIWNESASRYVLQRYMQVPRGEYDELEEGLSDPDLELEEEGFRDFDDAAMEDRGRRMWRV